MIFLLVLVSVLFILYAAVISYYNSSWRAMPNFQSQSKAQSHTFSVIIPARNEADNIGRLLESVYRQTYTASNFEVIVVDDHSTDDTAAIVKQFEGVHLIQLKEDQINSYKKKAIEKGVAAANNQWIVCTDADCVVPQNWLSTIADFIEQSQAVFVAAPVNLMPGKNAYGQRPVNLIYIFQALDFLTLQGITAASVYKQQHNMCNGANLAYKRSIFYEVEGFKGIDHIASGDDMLLMHKIWKRCPKQVSYLKASDAIVETDAAASWKAFFHQRIRWASKASSYDDKRIFRVLLLVYAFNVSFLVLLIASFFNVYYLLALALFVVLKTLVEFPFVGSVSRFFNRQRLLKYFLFFQPMHIFYTIISGFLGSFGKYEWKGRKVK